MATIKCVSKVICIRHKKTSLEIVMKQIQKKILILLHVVLGVNDKDLDEIKHSLKSNLLFQIKYSSCLMF
jgi:hypothetical protein